VSHAPNAFLFSFLWDRQLRDGAFRNMNSRAKLLSFFADLIA